MKKVVSLFLLLLSIVSYGETIDLGVMNDNGKDLDQRYVKKVDIGQRNKSFQVFYDMKQKDYLNEVMVEASSNETEIDLESKWSALIGAQNE